MYRRVRGTDWPNATSIRNAWKNDLFATTALNPTETENSGERIVCVSIFQRALAEDECFISTDFQAAQCAFHRCEPPTRDADADNITFSCPFYGYCHASAALIRPSKHAFLSNFVLLLLALYTLCFALASYSIV